MTATATAAALALIREWHEFHILAGSAAATLLGLLFVAITLNGDIILGGSRPHLKRVAEQAFQNYVAVLVTALLFVQPGQSIRMLAISMLSAGTVFIVWAVYRLIQVRAVFDQSFSRRRTFRRMLPALASYAAMIYGGVQMFRDFNAEDLACFSFSSLALLISATAIAWDLLLKVAEIRHKHA